MAAEKDADYDVSQRTVGRGTVHEMKIAQLGVDLAKAGQTPPDAVDLWMVFVKS